MTATNNPDDDNPLIIDNNFYVPRHLYDQAVALGQDVRGIIPVDKIHVSPKPKIQGNRATFVIIDEASEMYTPKARVYRLKTYGHQIRSNWANYLGHAFLAWFITLICAGIPAFAIGFYWGREKRDHENHYNLNPHTEWYKGWLPWEYSLDGQLDWASAILGAITGHYTWPYLVMFTSWSLQWLSSFGA